MRAAGAVIAALLIACVVPACRRTSVPAPTPTPAPVPTPVPAPTPPPSPYVPNKRVEVGRMFSGAQVRTTLETEFGGSATAVRNDAASYAVDVTVRVKIPKPHQSLDELVKLNERLPALLPGLPALLESAKISPLWDHLYRLKTDQLKKSLNRFDTLLSRHDLYDCETALELQHPDTKRRALLIQADMDTDDDGSDSDRVPEIDGSSANFQPFTSYRWAKKTDKPNSFLAPRETRLRQYETELATPNLNPARAKELKSAITKLKSDISDLKQYSFLVASTDPYVVLPLSMAGKKTPFAAAVGDYCVVVHGNALYPRDRRRRRARVQSRRRIAAPLPATQLARRREQPAGKRTQGDVSHLPRHRRARRRPRPREVARALRKIARRTRRLHRRTFRVAGPREAGGHSAVKSGECGARHGGACVSPPTENTARSAIFPPQRCGTRAFPGN